MCPGFLGGFGVFGLVGSLLRASPHLYTHTLQAGRAGCQLSPYSRLSIYAGQRAIRGFLRKSFGGEGVGCGSLQVPRPSGGITSARWPLGGLGVSPVSPKASPKQTAGAVAWRSGPDAHAEPHPHLPRRCNPTDRSVLRTSACSEGWRRARGYGGATVTRAFSDRARAPWRRITPTPVGAARPERDPLPHRRAKAQRPRRDRPRRPLRSQPGPDARKPPHHRSCRGTGALSGRVRW